MIVDIFADKWMQKLMEEWNKDPEIANELSNISFSALQFDTNWYIIVYRANIDLKILRTTGKDTKVYMAEGLFDFTIEPNAVITDIQRFDSIKQASLKALDSFVAQVGAEGSRQ